MRYGYARVSSAGQDLDIQISKLQAAGCGLIRAEKISGASRQGRAELDTLLAFVQPGDEIWITRIDRLARSIRDLANIVAELKAKGVTIKATEQQIDTSTPAGNAFLNMLGVFAEFETAIRSERQAEGIAKAKAAGRYIGKGRPPVIDPGKVRAALALDPSPSRVAKALGVSRSTVYRCGPDNLSNS